MAEVDKMLERDNLRIKTLAKFKCLKGGDL